MSACRVCESTTDGFLCRACLDKVERAIGDVPSLLHELSLLATGQTRVYRESGHAKGPDEELAELEEEYGYRMARIPPRLRSRDGRVTLPQTERVVNLDAREKMFDVGNTVSTWARHLAESRGVEPPTAADMVAWLLRNVEAFRWDEAAAEAFDEITAVHREAEWMVDRSPSRIYAGPCTNPDCRQPVEGGDDGETVPTDLYAPWKPAQADEEHADEVNEKEFACDGHRSDGIGCGQTYTWASRRPWLVESIQDSLVTVDDLLAALPDLFPEMTLPPRGSVTGWVRDGRLVAHGRNHVGEDTFRGSELLSLVAAYRPHRFAPRRRRAA